MKPGNKQKWTAYVLIIITVALLAVTLWLVLAHRPPMDRPGPPPEGPALFDGPRPDVPPEGFPPEGFRPDGPGPLSPEAKMALVSLLVVIMTLCVLAAVKLLRKKPAAIPASSAPLAPSAPEAPVTINFKTDYKTVTVALDDIRYIESMSEYVKIYLDSQPDPLVVLYSLKRLTAELPASRFMRIHRSYIVALDRIREANASSVVLDTPVTLPVGESYRAAFREYLSKL
jgi:hypothetical protein